MKIENIGNDKFKISDKNIDCVFSNGKISGKGSVKYSEQIKSSIANFKLESTLDKVGEVYNSESEDYRELASLSFLINSLSDNVTVGGATFKQIKKWHSNPIKYANEIQQYSKYLYGTTGVVSQTMNLFTGLHGLSSSLNQTNPEEEDVESRAGVDLYDSYINKETLVRDILKEVVHGTAIGYIYRRRWVQMLDMELYVPTNIINGYWQCRIDLLKLTTANDDKSIYDYPVQYQEERYSPREEIISRQPEEIRFAFKKWQSGKGKRYYDIPVDKTIVIKLNATQQERYGRSLAMPAFDDLLHKQLIRQAEEILLDKIVNQVLVLTMGEGGGKETDGYFKPTKEQRKQVGTATKQVLNKDSKVDELGTKIIGLPWWAKLEAVAIDLDLFKSKKYEEINTDILQSLGVGDIFGTSDNGSYASATISIELFFRQIFIVLEQIEDQLFDRIYGLISKNRNNIYTRRFSRGTTIGKEKIAVLTKLFDIGGSVKALLDEIGEDYDKYVKQVRAEKADGLHELFEPFRTSSTMGNEDSGRPDEGGSGDGNNNPKPSTS